MTMERKESAISGEFGSSLPSVNKKPGLLARMWRYLQDRPINSRLIQFEEAEAKVISRQRLAKIDAILSEQEIKILLVQRLITSSSHKLLQEPWEVLRRKYGVGMAEWLLERAKQKGLDLFDERALRESFIQANDSLDTWYVDAEAIRLKAFDPLANWFKHKTDMSGKMMGRIERLATAICSKVKWSLLIDPGRPRTDLSDFFTEFDVLEAFFDKADLSYEERSQRAFDANCLTKVRDKKIECVDWSRVKLLIPGEVPKAGASKSETEAAKCRPQPSDIFGDPDCPAIQVRSEYGHGDFIHASRVFGGPLLNTFILTQAPLPQTIPDFWRMVWQEKSEFIFMLCDAVEVDSEGLMSSAIPNYCPVYWPRYEGEVSQFGRLMVRNDSLNTRVDSLFNVTHLTLWMDGEPENELEVQHWQWDWKRFTDFNWPFRLLLRSRQSKRPTIIQCMDGCGRSGTLVLIEIFLMQLLHGATSQDNPMLTSAVFLRLQRRHAVTSHMQYLFAYRTVLHWIQPFVTSRYHRLVLGYTFSNSGFVGKYRRIVSSITPSS